MTTTPPDIDLSQPAELELLSQREKIIARAAAKMAAQMAAELAVKQITDNFYKDVGKTFVSKWLIIIGAMVVSFGAGKGWISFGSFLGK